MTNILANKLISNSHRIKSDTHHEIIFSKEGK
ncbi:hypothetical protein YPS_0576 [Yersinia pestis Pestoides A]|nr:hypothetical protein YPS_0576 [Yersinia pestis Pestoides A]